MVSMSIWRANLTPDLSVPLPDTTQPCDLTAAQYILVKIQTKLEVANGFEWRNVDIGH